MPSGKLLYVFARKIGERRRRVELGELPAETLYGLIELARRGWSIDVADDHFSGHVGSAIRPLAQKLRHYDINLVDWRTLRRFGKYDAVVFKDDLSIMTSLVSRMQGVPCLYLDSMFQLPKSSWRLQLLGASVRMAHSLVGYSRTQADLWSQQLSIDRSRFHEIPFGLDLDFYPRTSPPSQVRGNYVLAVGRDPGRDYNVLASAIAHTNYRLKLVTLPYLNPTVPISADRVDFLPEVSYAELFSLYEHAAVVVVPLKDRLTYPSGIRGMLEAMAVGRPVIATGTPCLEEYATDGADVLFVPPQSTDALGSALCRLQDDAALSDRLAYAARLRVERDYTVNHSANALEVIIANAIGGRV